MVIVFREQLAQLLQIHGAGGSAPLLFERLDDGDAYVAAAFARRAPREPVSGLVVFQDRERQSGQASGQDAAPLPDGVDVMVVAPPQAVLGGDAHTTTRLTARVRTGERIETRDVQLIPFGDELFSRVRGMYETDALRDKTVLVVGVGSGGSAIVMELAKAGVGHFLLVDHDRLEVSNVVRHVCGISDVGRFKTKAVRDLILDKNPNATVETFETECAPEWMDELSVLVRRVDLVFCCTDNRLSRVVVNRVCIHENRRCIYGGTFTRAYGGHVLRVVPGETMCYQCFVQLLPVVDQDREIASDAQAQSVAYADRPVAVEPGLATDIAPISMMCAKLGILELLRGQATTLSSLYDDLSSAWFQWLNRRERGTDYEALAPLDSGADELRILAWYGIPTQRDPECPACGDFINARLRRDGLTLTPEAISAFAARPEDSE